MKNMLYNARLTTRVYLAVGALLVFISFIGAAGIYSAMRLGDLFVDYRSVARLNSRYGELQEHLLYTRLQAFRWRATRANDALDATRNELALLNEATDEARALARSGGFTAVAQALAERLDQSQRYQSRFADAIDIQNDRNQLVAAFRDVAGEAVAALRGVRGSAFQDGDLEASHYAGLLADSHQEALAASERYLVRNEDGDRAASLEAFNRAAGDVGALIRRLENAERRDAANRVQLAVGELELGFEEISELIRRRNAIFAELDRIGPELAAAYGGLVDEGIARQDALGPIAAKTVDDVRIVIIAAAAIALALGALLGVALGRNISREAARIVDATRRLAGGDLDVEIHGADRANEFGRIANALAVFRDNLRENEKLRAANDDAKTLEELRAQRRQELLRLGDTFEKTVGSVVETVTAAAAELQATASQLAATADTSLERSANVAGAADQANANVQAVAAAAEELATAISEVAARVTGSADVARKSAEGATDSERELDVLHKALEEVDSVIAAIDEVAEQTNLLALNATIEAARAGEAGRGFAVVASEVKTLANQTKRMTQEIAERLNAVRTSAARAIDSTRAIIRSVQDINASSTAVAASVEQQGGATSEISRNAQEAAGGAEHVSQGDRRCARGGGGNLPSDPRRPLRRRRTFPASRTSEVEHGRVHARIESGMKTTGGSSARSDRATRFPHNGRVRSDQRPSNPLRARA